MEYICEKTKQTKTKPRIDQCSFWGRELWVLVEVIVIVLTIIYTLFCLLYFIQSACIINLTYELNNKHITTRKINRLFYEVVEIFLCSFSFVLILFRKESGNLFITLLPETQLSGMHILSSWFTTLSLCSS